MNHLSFTYNQNHNTRMHKSVGRRSRTILNSLTCRSDWIFYVESSPSACSDSGNISPLITQPLLIHHTHLLCCTSLASFRDMNTLAGRDGFCFRTSRGPDLLLNLSQPKAAHSDTHSELEESKWLFKEMQLSMISWSFSAAATDLNNSISTRLTFIIWHIYTGVTSNAKAMASVLWESTHGHI